MAHELAPAEKLPDKAFGAGERDQAFIRSLLYVADELRGKQPGKVDQGRGLGVEELEMIVAHGVFIRTEGGQEVSEREAPHAIAIGLSAGEVEVLN